MARTARIDLHRRNALRADAFGIDVAGDIAFDDGDVVFVAQRFDRRKNSGRLARTRTRQKVEHKHALLLEQRAVIRRKTVVLIENRLFQIYFHGSSYHLCLPAHVAQTLQRSRAEALTNDPAI